MKYFDNENLEEDYDILPQEVKDILSSFNEDRGFDECRRVVDELEELGYKIDYGMDGSLYNLRKVLTKEETEFRKLNI
jgi:hypothetical protein